MFLEEGQIGHFRLRGDMLTFIEGMIPLYNVILQDLALDV